MLLVVFFFLLAANNAEIVNGESLKVLERTDIRRLFADPVYRSSNGCSCIKYNCGCCQHIEYDPIGLNDTLCANLSYLPDEYGISFTLTDKEGTIINETISARNPPPICAAVPYLKKEASLCIRFSNLTVHNRTLEGCVSLEIRLLKIIEKDIKLGCFKIPPGTLTENSYMLKVPARVEDRRQFGVKFKKGFSKTEQSYMVSSLNKYN